MIRILLLISLMLAACNCRSTAKAKEDDPNWWMKLTPYEHLHRDKTDEWLLKHTYLTNSELGYHVTQAERFMALDVWLHLLETRKTMDAPKKECKPETELQKTESVQIDSIPEDWKK